MYVCLLVGRWQCPQAGSFGNTNFLTSVSLTCLALFLPVSGFLSPWIHVRLKPWEGVFGVETPDSLALVLVHFICSKYILAEQKKVQKLLSVGPDTAVDTVPWGCPQVSGGTMLGLQSVGWLPKAWALQSPLVLEVQLSIRTRGFAGYSKTVIKPHIVVVLNLSNAAAV